MEPCLAATVNKCCIHLMQPSFSSSVNNRKLRYVHAGRNIAPLSLLLCLINSLKIWLISLKSNNVMVARSWRKLVCPSIYYFPFYQFSFLNGGGLAIKIHLHNNHLHNYFLIRRLWKSWCVEYGRGPLHHGDGPDALWKDESESWQRGIYRIRRKFLEDTNSGIFLVFAIYLNDRFTEIIVKSP